MKEDKKRKDGEKLRRITKLILSLMTLSLIASCSDSDINNTDIPEKENITVITEEKTTTVPELVGKSFDSTLQEALMNDGFILSVKNEFSDTIPQGQIITQTPEGGKTVSEKGVKLELVISAGRKDGTVPENTDNATEEKPEEKNEVVPEQPKPEEKTEEHPQPQTNITVPSGKGLTAPKWMIAPTVDYDILYTFGKTGYSICKKWDNYGIIDMSGKPYGTGAYTKLFYCTEHGLSSPDVKEPTSISDDLVISPDCGFKAKDEKNIYVFDNTRNKVYLTGYSEGRFKIADITETEFFKTNASYIAVLYDCDADLMMYEGIGMESLEEIFRAENRKMHYGVVNNEFYTLVEFAYDSIRDGNDCYIVEKSGKYGYRGLSGQYYYECIFEEANTAYLGTAWVKYGGKWGTVIF